MRLTRTLPALSLCLLTACSSTTTSTVETPPPADSADAGDTTAKERELENARTKLQIAQLKAEDGEISAVAKLHDAERDLQRAQQELEQFNSVVRPHEVARRTLDLDRARQRVVESEQELSELEAMYAQEDFAETTKELVLMRGRAQLEMARRNLELAEQEAAQLESFDHPRREQELTAKVEAAERGVKLAQLGVQRGQLERELSLREAQHKLEELEEELAEASS